jgi:hypothetical protein
MRSLSFSGVIALAAIGNCSIAKRAVFTGESNLA